MRKHLRKETDFVVRVEQLARHLVELADEEKRLAETLRNVRRVKARLVAELANAAKAVAEAEKL